jgi:hypothetical protein
MTKFLISTVKLLLINRSAEEVAAFRASKEITIKGRDVPKPIHSFDELNVTDQVLEDLT